MRGKSAPECTKSLISPKKSTLESCKDGEGQAQRGYAPVVARGGGFFEKPLCPFARSGHQNAQTPLSPRVGSEGRAYRGRFLGKPLRAISGFRHEDAQTPPSPRVGEGGWGDAHRGRFFGKPLRAISGFRHEDAQTPPSPRVGEGGRGDEGQPRIRTPKLPLLPVWEKGAGGMRGKCAPECSKPLISPKKSTLESRKDGEGQGCSDVRRLAPLPRAHRLVGATPFQTAGAGHLRRGYACDDGRRRAGAESGHPGAAMTNCLARIRILRGDTPEPRVLR
jgi:hypothetical protein